MQEKPSRAPRRVKTKAPGVYRSSSGKYEVQFRDSDGRLRFKTMDGSFEDAKQLRAELTTKVRKGELVRPTRATFGEYAEAWLAGLDRRPNTLSTYRYALDRHLLPRFKRRRLTEIQPDDLRRMVVEMKRDGFSAATTGSALNVLAGIMKRAVREGQLASSPLARLDAHDRPKPGKADRRILSETEITAVLARAGRHRPLIAVLIFAGLRMGEALGLRWENIDFDQGFIRVRKQLDRRRQLVEPKTDSSVRDVVLLPELAGVLRQHRLASRFSADSDFVFPSPEGRGRDHTSASSGIEGSLRRAGLAGAGITAHTFRHTFASMLIVGLKIDPARVSKQLGHAKVSITLDTYTHLFEQARHSDELRAAVSERYGHLLDGNVMSTTGRNQPQLRAVESA
ncbi:MAG TPA: site-specific integrase [Gemmatimonadaceae bacterium]|nr:site-specific integrase [Gemmatimonadaceae bacterium]